MKSCNQTATSGNLWNAMINPYIVGPHTVRGSFWYQGEANVGQDTLYACLFPAMITDWRKQFKNTNSFWFGFVQLAGYNYGAGPSPGDLRTAQLAALTLPDVGYSTAIDVGTWNDIHPKDKQTVAKRLANSLLQGVYGQNIAWQFPRYASAVPAVNGTAVTVTISFQANSVGTGLTLTVPSYAAVQQANICVPGLTTNECGFPTIELNDANHTVLNATVSLSSDNQKVILSGTAPAAGLSVVSTSYGRASWPVTTVFTSLGLPVIPWYVKF